MTEAGARIRDSNPTAALRSVVVKSRPVIGDRDLEQSFPHAGLDGQSSRGQATSDPVTNRVLRQRLQAHVWDEGVHNFRTHLQVDLQPVLIANSLDFQVGLEEFELAAQGYLLGFGLLHGAAQQVPEASGQLFGLRVAAAPDERHDRIQRIEQEVRLKLILEYAQLRLHELRLELRRLDLGPAGIAVIVEDFTGADDDPVRKQARMEAKRKRRRYAGTQIRQVPGDPEQVAGARRKDRRDDRDGGAQPEVGGHPASRVSPCESDPSSESDDHRGEQAPYISAEQPTFEHREPPHWLAGMKGLCDVLSKEEDANQRPQASVADQSECEVCGAAVHDRLTQLCNLLCNALQEKMPTSEGILGWRRETPAAMTHSADTIQVPALPSHSIPRGSPSLFSQRDRLR